ncbi:MAG: hypothetical protein HY897_01955 [Deltaproteobacteria bacterium]|nr:hypothetical protein [Deltaproteobacteria bacterium]
MGVLTELVIDKVTRTQRYQVVGQKDLDKMLFWEQNKQLKGCTDTACLVQIAGAMGAQYYVEGSIGGLGDEYIITLKLIDAQSVKVLERSTEKLSRDEKALSRGMEKVADIILGNKPADDSPPGARVGAPEAKRSAPVATAAVVPGPGAFDKKLWGQVGVYSGVGFAALGGIFAALAKKTGDDYKAAGSQAEMDDLASKNGLYNTMSLSGFVAGGVLAATGGVLWYIGGTEKPAAALMIVPAVTPGNVSLEVGGAW